MSLEAINELRREARNIVRELGLLNDAYFDIGVTLAERHLLIELMTSPSPTMGEIAARLLLDKSTVSRLISNAVKKGYVECITDEKDKRKRFLHMTRKGRETLNAFEPIAFNQTKEALLTLTNEEIQTVYKGVALYAKSLKSSRMKTEGDGEKPNFLNKGPVNNKIENWNEVISRLGEMGNTLDLFDQKDDDQLYEIFREVVDSGSQFPYESSTVEEYHRQFFGQQGKVYVCHASDGKVLGGFYIKANYTDRSSHIGNAAYMISSTHRGKGVGSLLIKASLHLAKELGFHAMQFNRVLSQNKLAVKLYERLGFNIVGIIPQAVRNPEGSYQDCYVMHRTLDNI